MNIAVIIMPLDGSEIIQNAFGTVCLRVETRNYAGGLFRPPRTFIFMIEKQFVVLAV